MLPMHAAWARMGSHSTSVSLRIGWRWRLVMINSTRRSDPLDDEGPVKGILPQLRDISSMRPRWPRRFLRARLKQYPVGYVGDRSCRDIVGEGEVNRVRRNVWVLAYLWTVKVGRLSQIVFDIRQVPHRKT